MSFRSWFQSWWPPWGKKLNSKNQFKSDLDLQRAAHDGYKNKNYTGTVNLSNIKVMDVTGRYVPINDEQFKVLIKSVVNDGTRHLNVSGNALTAEKLEALYNHLANYPNDPAERNPSRKPILLDSITFDELEKCPDRIAYHKFTKVNDVMKIQANNDLFILHLKTNFPWIDNFKSLSHENTAEELKAAIQNEIFITKKRLDNLKFNHPDQQKNIDHLELRFKQLKVFFGKNLNVLDKAIEYENRKKKFEKTEEFHEKLKKFYDQDGSSIQTRQRSNIHPLVLQAMKPEPLVRAEDLFPKQTKQQDATVRSNTSKKDKISFYDPNYTPQQVVQPPTATDIYVRKGIEKELKRGEKDHAQKLADIDRHYAPIQSAQSEPPKQSTLTTTRKSTNSNQPTTTNDESSEFDPSKPLPLPNMPLIISGGPQSIPTQVVDKEPSPEPPVEPTSKPRAKKSTKPNKS